MKIEVVRRAHLAVGAEGYARSKIARLARYSREPVGLARLTFTASGNPAVHRHVHVQARLDVDGRPLVAHAEAATAREAVDALDARLKRRLLRMSPHWQARRGRTYRLDRRPAAEAVPARDEGPAVTGP